MNLLKQAIVAFWREEEGLTAVEYAVAGSLVALAVVGAFTDLGNAVHDKICAMVEAIGSQCTTGAP
jgi:pilus assembly protein Flp/PilA